MINQIVDKDYHVNNTLKDSTVLVEHVIIFFSHNMQYRYI